MAFRPNYRQKRNERTRTKEAKKEKKLLRLQERVAARKPAEAPVEGDQAPAAGDNAPAQGDKQ
jgi:hypothetical protein